MRGARLVVVVVGAVLALWSAVGALAAVAPDARDAPSEADFLARLDSARSAAGLGSLAARDDLVDVARRHSEDMATQHRLYHNPSLQSQVTGWQRVGENVGTGSDVASVHDAFMQSPVHRDDILSPYFTEVGIGVVWDGSTLWVTEVFRQPSSPAARPTPTPASAPAPAPVRRAQAARPVPPPPPTTVPVTAPPTTVAPAADPPTQSRFVAEFGRQNASLLEDARPGPATVPAPAVLGVTREQAIAVPVRVPPIPAPVGVAAGLLALVTLLQGVVVRRLGLA